MALLTAGPADTSTAWRLSSQVSLRDESFGALAYHHVTRRLVFLKSPTLVELVRRLEEFESANAALDVLAPPGQRARYQKALVSLWGSEIICGR